MLDIEDLSVRYGPGAGLLETYHRPRDPHVLEEGTVMKKMASIAPVVLAVLLGSAASAMAADFCIRITGAGGGANILALKAFTLPSRGVCRDYQGFYIAGPVWTRGTACGSSNNARITFFDALHDDAGTPVGSEKFFLSRTDLTGTGTACTVDTGTGGSCSPISYAHVACSPAAVPVPE